MGRKAQMGECLQKRPLGDLQLVAEERSDRTVRLHCGHQDPTVPGQVELAMRRLRVWNTIGQQQSLGRHSEGSVRCRQKP